VFPISLARSVNALRYTSALGVLCAIYLGAAITIIFFVDKDLVTSPLDNLKHADLFKVINIFMPFNEKIYR
jgi:hypothetical protein